MMRILYIQQRKWIIYSYVEQWMNLSDIVLNVRSKILKMPTLWFNLYNILKGKIKFYDLAMNS